MENNGKRGIQLGPGEGSLGSNPLGGTVTLKVRAEQSNGTLGAFETVTAPCEGPPLHVHPEMDEILYILEGRFRVKLDDDVADAEPRAFVFIPRGVVHTWQCVGDGPGRFLAIVTPAGFERFFEQAAEAAHLSRADVFRTLGREVGMNVVGPPLAESDPG
jgi:quercetin dioxygenase-like cupin family protein